MDMSVKLSLSYPAPRSADPVSDKPVSRAVEGTAASADDVPEPKVSADAEKVRSAVSEIEKFLSSTRRNLEFFTDEESGKVVVKVIASDTGELIRQLPSEEALRIARSLSDANSILFDAKV